MFAIYYVMPVLCIFNASPWLPSYRHTLGLHYLYPYA